MGCQRGDPWDPGGNPWDPTATPVLLKAVSHFSLTLQPLKVALLAPGVSVPQKEATGTENRSAKAKVLNVHDIQTFIA